MLFATGLILNSCVDEFWPDLGSKYEELLVVDGLISDSPGPYTVKLSLSTQVERPYFVPLENAQVSISDDSGNSNELAEIDKGTYQTTNPDFIGKVGKKYKIHIETAEGKKYESGFQELRMVAGIDSVYAKIEYNYSKLSGQDVPGYQFYIDTDYPEMDTNYFIWQLENTFKFQSNYTLKFIYDGSYHTPGQYDSIYNCWKTDIVNGIYLVNTENLAQPAVKGFPLNFVSTETKKLSIKYSLLVRQLSVTKEAYEFWNNVGLIEEGQGALFATQPYQVRGNVKNVDDDNEPVLGYFITAGMTEKRIFIDKPTGVPFYYDPTCALITEDLYWMLRFMRSQWPVVLTAIPTESGGLVPALPVDQSCIDCQQAFGGSTINKPDFWED